MGRSYWFECARCGYRAKVSGREDRGRTFFVQTEFCRDCRELYDAVSRALVPGGLYIQFQYSLMDRKKIRTRFQAVRTVPVILNVPPAVVYYAQK